MMFSTKAEYGVRVMAHLARAAGEASARDGAGTVEAPISLGSIADAEGLPLAYLEHLVQRLRRAELVESRRGAHGGYTLARPADTISMSEVVRALEGEIAPIECITADPERGLVCVREGDLGDDPCPTKLLWTRVQGSIVRTLNEMTLADLVRPARGGPAKPDRPREAGRRPPKADRGARRAASSMEPGRRPSQSDREAGRAASSREAGRRPTESDRGAGRPAEVTIPEKATA